MLSSNLDVKSENSNEEALLHLGYEVGKKYGKEIRKILSDKYGIAHYYYIDYDTNTKTFLIEFDISSFPYSKCIEISAKICNYIRKSNLTSLVKKFIPRINSKSEDDIQNIENYEINYILSEEFLFTYDTNSCFEEDDIGFFGYIDAHNNNLKLNIKVSSLDSRLDYLKSDDFFRSLIYLYDENIDVGLIDNFSIPDVSNEDRKKYIEKLNQLKSTFIDLLNNEVSNISNLIQNDIIPKYNKSYSNEYHQRLEKLCLKK